MPAKSNELDKTESVAPGTKPKESPVPDGHYEPVTKGPHPKGSPVKPGEEHVSQEDRDREMARVAAIFRKFTLDYSEYASRPVIYPDNNDEQSYWTDSKYNPNVAAQLRALMDNLRTEISNYTQKLGGKQDLSRDSVKKIKTEFRSMCEHHVNEALSKGLGDDLHWSKKLHNFLKEIGNFIATKVTGKNNFFTIEKSAIVGTVDTHLQEMKKDEEPGNKPT